MKIVFGLFFVISSSLWGTWAEERLKTLSREEKVGQFFIVSICPPRGKDHLEHLKQFLKKYPIGGVLLKQADPFEQVCFLNRIQAFSHLPLLTLVDAEWGLGMRMQKTLSYPRNLTLGAVQNHELLREMGYQIAQQCQLVGAHLNLAPVVDVNTHLDNRVIGVRSLGDDPKQVALRGAALIKGMQEGGLFACLKHFPGHGDTTSDSHIDLPVILHDYKRLDQVELLPFKEGIAAKVACILTAHLLIPDLDCVPSTFSSFIVTDLLQKQMGFDGLVITDALNMGAITNDYSLKEVGLKSFLAGHHLLLYGSHQDEEVDAILNEMVPQAFQALVESEVSDEMLDDRVLKILQAKEKLGLHEGVIIKENDDLMDQLHDPAYSNLIAHLFEEAITIYRDEGLPKSEEKIAYIQIGKKELAPFFSDLKELFDVTFVPYEDAYSLKEFDQVILALYGDVIPQYLRHLNATTFVFTDPYALATCCPESGTIVVAYEGVRGAEKAAIKLIKEELIPKGKLPISFPN